MTADPIIGRRRFTDGRTRDVLVVADGKYILDDDGAKVRGIGLLMDQIEEADRPLIVE
jgi:hypothetical protein